MHTDTIMHTHTYVHTHTSFYIDGGADIETAAVAGFAIDTSCSTQKTQTLHI